MGKAHSIFVLSPQFGFWFPWFFANVPGFLLKNSPIFWVEQVPFSPFNPQKMPLFSRNPELFLQRHPFCFKPNIE
jgi:hypothetical protein